MATDDARAAAVAAPSSSHNGVMATIDTANETVDDAPLDATTDDVVRADATGDTPLWERPLVHGIAVGFVVAVAAVLAVSLHRNGHARGDDFALYLRQARSLFDGNIGEVVADNRFTVINSTGPFSPYAYPWGLPLLLSPFVHLWDLDYARLKLVEVAAFCVWLVLIHGIVRRRVGRVLALAVTAAVATAPAFLSHTGQLLSEFPHAAAVAVVIWWLDRMRTRGPLVGAAVRDLVVLGVLVTIAYNIRREGIVLVGAIGVVQLVELVTYHRDVPVRRYPWRNLAIPHAAFVASVVGFQLLLPSMLFPDNGDNAGYVDDRLGGYPPRAHPADRSRFAPCDRCAHHRPRGRRCRHRDSQAPRARWAAHRRRCAVRGRSQHAFPDGWSVLLPDHSVGAVLRSRRDRRSRPPRVAPVAIGDSSPCSQQCRCCTSSASTPRSCPVTSSRSKT